MTVAGLEPRQRADVDRDLEQDNAELRVRYLREVPTYTAADIHQLMHGSKLSNPNEPASRWKREKRVFAVRAGTAQLFPRFQFADGYPLPVIKERHRSNLSGPDLLPVPGLLRQTVASHGCSARGRPGGR